MRLSVFVVLMLVIGSCIDPFLYTPGSIPFMYVIDGKISDRPGPYTVTITASSSLESSVRASRIAGASVTITDDEGVIEKLTDKGEGFYATKTLQGVVGKTYTLRVTTPDGSQYESTPQKIYPVGDITNLRAAVIEDPSSTDGDYGINLYADAKFDPEQEGRAHWKWGSTFKFVTFPEDNGHFLGSKTWVPTPLPCSGYALRGRNQVMTQFGPCTCCECYKTNFSRQVFVSHDEDIRGGEMKDVFLGFQKLDARMITEKLVIIVQQESATPDAYAFYRRVEKIELDGSDLFQTPPGVTHGNVTATTTDSKDVFGFFSAVAIKSDTVIVAGENVPYRLPDVQPYSNSCEVFYSVDNTTVKPDWY